MDERSRRGRMHDDLARRRSEGVHDRLRHALADGARSRQLPAVRRRARTPISFRGLPSMDDRNVQGATAIAVPGVVAGMGLAHERFGRMAWRELVEPAAALADEGLLVDWYSGLLMASDARALARDPRCRRDVSRGRPVADHRPMDRIDRTTPRPESVRRDAAPDRRQAAPVRSTPATSPARWSRDVRDKGGCLSEQDLASYRAQHRRRAGGSVSRRSCLRGTGHDRRSDARARPRDADGDAHPDIGATAIGQLCRVCPRARCRVQVALRADGRRRRRGAERACVHDALQRRRSRREFVRGDADACFRCSARVSFRHRPAC